MKNLIYLVGMMGCGKSSIGVELAKISGFDFIDIDAEIVKESGKEINQIFSDEGEVSFRKKEKAKLLESSSHPKRIISTGGGIVLDSENISHMQQSGNVVYLQASIDTLIERIQGTTHRPLLDQKNWQEVLGSLLKERMPKYEQASNVVFDTDNKTAKQSAELLHKEISNL